MPPQHVTSTLVIRGLSAFSAGPPTQAIHQSVRQVEQLLKGGFAALPSPCPTPLSQRLSEFMAIAMGTCHKAVTALPDEAAAARQLVRDLVWRCCARRCRERRGATPGSILGTYL